MTTFEEFGLPESLRHTLAHMKYVEATPIQQAAIPIALTGKDILGSAQTGTGKTAAFAVPLVAKMLENPGSYALVLTPTRELAMQVYNIINQMVGKSSKLPTALLIGGASMSVQIQQLRRRARIIVGTPGRVNDHLDRRSLKLYSTHFVVLDETDRMLDMGFSVQLEEIFKHLPEKRQMLMFSATMPANIVRMANKYLKQPERIAIGSTTQAINLVKQDIIQTTEKEKYGTLVQELKKRDGSIIIFVKTKYGTEKLAAKLNKENHSAAAIHGDLRQNQRKHVIDRFRRKSFRIMVATDIAARGLDIPHIEHVVNYDLPQAPEDYIHRVGRTGRAGVEGSALCLVSPEDRKRWKEIERMMDPNSKTEYEQARPPRRPRPRGGKKLNDRYAKKPFGFRHKSKDRNVRHAEGGGQRKSA